MIRDGIRRSSTGALHRHAAPPLSSFAEDDGLSIGLRTPRASTRDGVATGTASKIGACLPSEDLGGLRSVDRSASAVAKIDRELEAGVVVPRVAIGDVQRVSAYEQRRPRRVVEADTQPSR